MLNGNKKKVISIKSKLVRMQVFLAFLVLFASSAAFLANDLLMFKKAVVRNLESDARILNRNLVPALVFGDRGEAAQILSSLQSEPSIVSAGVYATNGEPFASYGNKIREESPPDLSANVSMSRFAGSHLVYYRRLGTETENHGVLRLDADLKVFALEYTVFIWVAIAIILAVLLLSVGLAQWIQRSLSEPIIELARTAKEISRLADYSLRMKVNDRAGEIEEIETLSTEFNQMLDQIQEQDHKIREEKDVAEKANTAKSVFLANISHELRTPMHGILSFARFGQQKIETATKEKLKSFFDEISDSGSRLMNLLNDLLDLSKMEANKVTYDMREDDLAAVADAACAEMKAFAQEKGLTFEVSAAIRPANAFIDASRMGQVLRNILSNAVKFSEKGSAIRVTIEQTPNVTRCKVINRGVGIPESELESIFDKFVQSSKTTTGAGGTGLGLAICKEIVQKHGGKVWAESEKNGETRFIIELPKSL